jgi:hypothetical protein
MTLRRLTMSTIAAAVLTAALAAVAHAVVVAAPNPVTFPEREVGSTSDPKVVTINVVCSNFRPDLNPGAPCLTNDTFTRNPQFVGDNPGDFFEDGGGNCPPTLTNTNAPVLQCQMSVRFKPTAAGERKALFIPGTSNTGGPAPVALEGSAVAKPVQTKKKCKKGKKKKCKKGKKKK